MACQHIAYHQPLTIRHSQILHHLFLIHLHACLNDINSGPCSLKVCIDSNSISSDSVLTFQSEVELTRCLIIQSGVDFGVWNTSQESTSKSESQWCNSYEAQPGHRQPWVPDPYPDAKTRKGLWWRYLWRSSSTAAGFATAVVIAAPVPYCWQQHNRKDYLNIAVYLIWGFIAWTWCRTQNQINNCIQTDPLQFNGLQGGSDVKFRKFRV